MGLDTSSWVTDIGRSQYSKHTKDVRKVQHKFYIMRKLLNTHQSEHFLGQKHYQMMARMHVADEDDDIIFTHHENGIKFRRQKKRKGDMTRGVGGHKSEGGVSGNEVSDEWGRCGEDCAGGGAAETGGHDDLQECVLPFVMNLLFLHPT